MACDAQKHEALFPLTADFLKSQKELLENVLDDVALQRGSLVVFDLDDTLFSTGNRHLRILHEYAEMVETSSPQAASLLRAIQRERLRYAITDTARDAGLEESLVKDLRDFWFARFFQNRYLLEDAPIPGAPEYCAEVSARGGIIVYVTGRDERMRIQSFYEGQEFLYRLTKRLASNPTSVP